MNEVNEAYHNLVDTLLENRDVLVKGCVLEMAEMLEEVGELLDARE